jgi:tRNA(fMet)-specific endonuclease VapC
MARSANELAITIITVQEQLDGWHSQLPRAKQADQLAAIYERLAVNVRFLARIQILPFTIAAIERYELLRRMKLNMGKMDLRIAAIVAESAGILVTRNTQDFARVPNLVIEDWTL